MSVDYRPIKVGSIDKKIIDVASDYRSVERDLNIFKPI